jgi:hypothetical protein
VTKRCGLCSFKTENSEDFDRHAAATHGLGPLAPRGASAPKVAVSPAAPAAAPEATAPTASEEFVAKGYNGKIIVRAQSVVISHKGAVALLVGQGLRGDKEIPLEEITAIQLKNAGMTAGYMQIAYKGSVESKGGVFSAAKDENSVNFYKGAQKDFERAKHLIEDRRRALLAAAAAPSHTLSPAEELARFAQLHRDGVLTDEEFAAKKKQLLGL